MFSLFVKLLVPVASAAAVYIAPKTATPLPQFEGTYTQVSGSCGSPTVQVSLDASTNSIIMIGDKGQTLASIPAINGARQDIQNGTSISTDDGFGNLSNRATDRFSTSETKASLKDGTLSIHLHVSQAFARGQGSRDATCILKK